MDAKEAFLSHNKIKYFISPAVGKCIDLQQNIMFNT